MHKSILSPFVCLLIGCTGDDVIYDQPEGGNGDGSSDATMQPMDSGGPDAFDASTDGQRRLLMTQTVGSTVEMAAFNISTGAVDGRFSYQATFPEGIVQTTSAGAFLVRTESDAIVRLDPNAPWKPTSTWSVAMNDAVDGGQPYANPVQVIVVSPTKAYVLRFNRNRIAILDPSQSADAGAPIGSVDLSGLLQADDLDGAVDMIGAIFDPVRKRLYVALGNIDTKRVDPMGFFIICANTKSTVVAIDTTNDMIVNLNGTGPQGSIALNGRGPQYGFLGGVTFDAAGDRMLVMSTGCQDKFPDGGPSPMKGRLIEAVSLSTNTTQTLLDANAQEFPGQLLFFSSNKAVVQFGFVPFATTFLWDPTINALGPALTASPDVFAYDGKGSIVGPRNESTADGGKAINVIGVPIASADAGATVLGKDPFTKAGGFFGNAALWP
jgi:hypothetical protein